ncbi:MAG: ABC transporter permease [Furfurilactobacillus sp.]|uniref:ABC transporter permease n=1 Tax=Furfurilactobacillus milii TaxID=2888272 RepID=A0ABT6DBC1_9LACO|nr:MULTISPECIES: ABC transporter permease [Furfurilactobacillus]QLE67719.1 Spermidine Putrescine ABC transporter permease component potC [Furfurilactobacillus rossiae]MCF6160430.1 ABC transporter permease [Furfurilactobacillus milii]MCF6162662.1 ABC transporter permease [Furfurilactobacillus milii]MCF6418330.1 ABC transporter permease [Furfurilactobacillus milii]MCH4011847.1 ABC transporter permease [Furfurilactobacillus sp.]
MRQKKHWLLTLYGYLMLLLLLLPLVLVVVTSFGSQAAITFPIKGFTLKWYANILSQPDFVTGFKTSFAVAVTASFLAIVIGTPAVYALTRRGIHHANWFQTVFLSPTLIPEIVIGFALFQSLVIGIKLPLMPVLITGHFLLSVPYVIRMLTARLLLFDQTIEEASWLSGASKIKTFFRVVIPNISGTLLAIFIMCFINSFNNIPITLFLNGPSLTMLPTAILNYLQNNYDPTVSAVSVILMLLTGLMMWLMERMNGLTHVNEHLNQKGQK